MRVCVCVCVRVYVCVCACVFYAAALLLHESTLASLSNPFAQNVMPAACTVDEVGCLLLLLCSQAELAGAAGGAEGFLIAHRHSKINILHYRK